MIVVRAERAGDEKAVRSVNVRAFEGTTEADIVDRLRVSGANCLSLVADDRGVVGHILFSPAVLDAGSRRITGMSLAPISVIPERQRQGLGSMLVRHGLDLLRQRACPFVVVLGHPGFYPRFGFVPASRIGIRCQWKGIPDEVFMALVLDQRAMAGVAGTACYRHEFDVAG